MLLREPIQGGDADLRLQRIERFQDDVKSILIAAIVGLAVSIMLTPYLIRFFSSGGVTIRGATGAFESVIPDYVASEPKPTDAELYHFRRQAMINTFGIVSRYVEHDQIGAIAVRIQPDDAELFELTRRYYGVGRWQQYLRQRQVKRMRAKVGEQVRR